MSSVKAYIIRLSKGAASLWLSLKTTFPYLIGYSAPYREATEEYPDPVSACLPEDLPARFRGFLENDINRCSGCRFCADVCPIDCIHIETEPGPERNVSWVSVFDINHARCMFCGLCAEVCPTKSLVHTKEYQGAVYQLPELVQSFGRGWATAEMKDFWRQSQSANDLRAEERAKLEQSPVGEQLRRWKEKNE